MPNADPVVYKNGETAHNPIRKYKMILRNEGGVFSFIILYLIKYWIGKKATGTKNAVASNPQA